jgi:hypothetical protein
MRILPVVMAQFCISTIAMAGTISGMVSSQEGVALGHAPN